MSSAPADTSAFRAPPGDPGDRPPRAAATIVVLRDGGRGIEVLLSRRAERGDHNSGAWVFPGGIVEPGDALAHAACDGLDDVEASARLDLARGASTTRSPRSASASRRRRCCSREATASADRPRRQHPATPPWRKRSIVARSAWPRSARAERLRLTVDRLVYHSHWMTPLGRPKSFDTRFFIAEAPAAQSAAHDGGETRRDAVDRAAAKRSNRSASLRLMTPTRRPWSRRRFATVAEAMAWRPRRARSRS